MAMLLLSLLIIGLSILALYFALRAIIVMLGFVDGGWSLSVFLFFALIFAVPISIAHYCPSLACVAG